MHAHFDFILYTQIQFTAVEQVQAPAACTQEFEDIDGHVEQADHHLQLKVMELQKQLFKNNYY